MNNQSHTKKFKKNVKKLKGFIKDKTIEKFINIKFNENLFRIICIFCY